MLTLNELVGKIEAHLAVNGESAAAFGIRVCRDPNLVRELRAGRSPRLTLITAILDAIEHKKVRKP